MTRNPCPVMCALLAFAATAAQAAPACTVSTNGIAFGSYSPLSGQARESIGAIDVRCTAEPSASISYTITLSAGNGAYATRQMASGPHALSYNLFRDSARMLVWGDGTGGSVALSDAYVIAASPVLRSYSVYGRIPGGQRNVHTGSYADQIIVSLAF